MQDHRLGLAGQGGGVEAGQRMIGRARDAFGGEFGGFADIDQHRFALGDQGVGVGGGDVAHGGSSHDSGFSSEEAPQNGAQ